MRTPALALVAAAAACRLVDPGACPESKPTISCRDAQEAVASGRVIRGIYGRCGTGITIADAGSFIAPERCDLYALCDGGYCPDVAMPIE